MSAFAEHAACCVIGGLGFIGVNLTAAPVADGRARHRADAVARAPRRAGRRRSSAAASEIVEGDLRDRGLMASARRRPAASSSTCRGSPARFAAWKIRGPISTSTAAATWCCSRRCARAIRDAKLVFAGSRLQYGTRRARCRSREDAPRRAAVPARHSQAHGRAVPAALRARSSALRYAVARVTNPYGPGQPQGRTAYGVINRLIHLALADRAADHLRRRRAAARLRPCGRRGRGAAGAGGIAAGRRPRLQRRQRHRHAAGRPGERRSSTIAGGGRIEHVAWPALAAADRDRRLRRRHLAASGASSAGRRRSPLRDGPRADRRVLPARQRRTRDDAAPRARASISSHAFTVGGAEEMVLNLVRHLPPRFEPAVCCIHEAGPIGEEIRRDRRAVRGARPHAGPAAAARRAAACATSCTSCSPTIVHTFLLTASLYGRFAAMMARRADRDRHRSQHLRAASGRSTRSPSAG